jgi:restriction endonuclease S subunit
MRLDQAADYINVGQIMTRVEAKIEAGEEGMGEVRVLLPKAVTSAGIHREELPVVQIKQSIEERKFTRKGDIVIKLSTPYDAVYIGEEEAGLACTSFCGVIRGLDEQKLDPHFLTAYLNTSYVKEFLRLKAGSTTLPVVKIRDLRELMVPDIPVDKQKALGKLYQSSAEKIGILESLIDNEKRMMNSMLLTEIKEYLNE